jgi:nitroimidazol reductase NimA-like FMN-containing flavoprotein (pyridoxamine 5'-phosphate oxidase superfamily)
MGIRLNTEEQAEFLERGHTAIITTVKRDGWPVSLPVWYVYVGGHIYIGSPEPSAKIKRIRHDNRAWFLAESGEKWKELAAVGFAARAVLVNGDEFDRAMAVFDEKYAAFRTPEEEMPDVAARYYSKHVVFRLDQVGDAVTWDNSRIRLKTRSG